MYRFLSLTRPRPLVGAVMPVAVALLTLAAGAGPALAGDDGPPVEDRVAALEAQIRELQAFLAEELGFGVDDPSFSPKTRELSLPARVLEKKFTPKDAAAGNWEDYLQIEVGYDTTPLGKPAVAIKGTLEFADPFGKVHFTMPTSLADNIKPGREVSQRDLRFKYNQFRDAHTWMNGTEASDMVVLLRISAIRYADGTTEEYRL